MKNKNFHSLLLTVFVLLSLCFNTVKAQFPGCPQIDAGPDQTLTCSQPCVTLTSTPFHAGATTSYTAESIPHTPPISYTESGGTAVSVNIDDKWSPLITLPFNFCFYGQMYNTCKIGSNGAIKFGNFSSTFHPWSFSATCPSSALTDMGNVYGIYHDIDPSVAGGTIKWYLLGSAPCRIFVVVFNNLAHFNCNSKRSTHMMVLYETTNAIDVYVQKKELCSSWNGGRAIIGIQNMNGSQGITAPGRNSNTTWTITSPEGWRFTPNGAPIYTVDWLKNGQVIGTGPTIQVCPAGSETYTARATYTKCDGTTIIETDQVTVAPSPNNPVPVLTQMIHATCNQSNGGLVISGSGGVAPYTYSADNTNFSASGTFNNLPVGNHTIYIKDANGCIGAGTFEVTTGAPILFSITNTQNVKCFNANDGIVTSSATGGTGTLRYSLNGGTAQTSGTFNNLAPGTYTIVVTDDNGCSESQTFTITQPTELTITLNNVTNTLCNQPNGAVVTSAAGGTGGLSYSLNGSPGQASGTFSSLTPDNYTVTVSDQNNCTASVTAQVDGQNSIVINTDLIEPVSCKGYSDGKISLSHTGGTAPFTYHNSVTNSTQNNGIYTDLAPGTYIIKVTDAQGCEKSATLEIIEPSAITVNITEDKSICSGDSTQLTVSASGGNGNFTYTWDNGMSGSPLVVKPTSTTTYEATATDSKGCNNFGTVKISVIPMPVAVLTASPLEGYPGTTVYFTNNSSNGYFFDWDFDNGFTLSNVPKQDKSMTYTTEGIYTVILTAKSSFCQDTASVKIKIIPFPDPEIFVPNVFTPNGDGANDHFWIDTKNITNINVLIFNRWGNLMAELKDPADKWDGTFQGKDAAEGVYFFKYVIVDMKGDTHSNHGFVTLER